MCVLSPANRHTDFSVKRLDVILTTNSGMQVFGSPRLGTLLANVPGAEPVASGAQISRRG